MNKDKFIKRERLVTKASFEMKSFFLTTERNLQALSLELELSR